MKRFLSQFPYRGGVSTKPRRKLFAEEVTSQDPFDRGLTSPGHGFRDHWIESEERQSQEFKEFSPGEKEKYEHKNNADFVYEGVSDFDGSEAVNPATGGPVNYFLDVEGEESVGFWETGAGNDVIYHKGGGFIKTNEGDDIAYLQEGQVEGLAQLVLLGDGNDKAIGGKGSQYANGGNGDDYFDLGDGSDFADGGPGADEFVVDLQNKGTDMILDFVDVGDKITVKNGGSMAQDGDWFLFKVNQYNGKEAPIHYDESISQAHPGQQFYEIRNSANEVAAIFGVGTRFMTINDSLAPLNYSLKASIYSGSIEILASEYCDSCETGSLQFG